MESSSLSGIINVWQSIGEFLFIEDTIAVSRTCKSLHDIIVDPVTHKVKISRFVVMHKENYARNLPWALNSIYFPSLTHLQYPPVIFNEYDEEDGRDLISAPDQKLNEKAVHSCFIMLATYLSLAHNLQYLSISGGSVMKETQDDTNTMKWVLDLLSTNLQYCCKLNTLNIFNGAMGIDNDRDLPIYSVAFLDAFTPALLKRSNELESLKLSVFGIPAQGEIEHSNQVLNDIFTAATSTKGLSSLSLDVCFDNNVINKLAEVSGRCADRHFDRLTSLVLRLGRPWPEEDEIAPPLQLVPTLKCFINCPLLQSIRLRVPQDLWAEKGSLRIFTELIKNKLHLENLSIDFGLMNDQDGNVFQLILDFAEDCKKNKYPCMKRFEIREIRSVSVVQLRKLMEIFEVCCGMSRQRLFCKDDNGTNWKISSRMDDDDQHFRNYTADTINLDWLVCLK